MTRANKRTSQRLVLARRWDIFPSFERMDVPYRCRQVTLRAFERNQYDWAALFYVVQFRQALSDILGMALFVHVVLFKEQRNE